MAPELSPDNGTTTSTNSTSPALSSTLSESSSLMDVNILQHQQQQLLHQQTQNTPTQPQQIQVVRTNQQIDQQSPGKQLKLPDQLLETNAFANKSEPSLSNNLLIMANEHKEFSCRVGDENVVNPTSNNSNNHAVVDNLKASESDDNTKLPESKDSFKSSNVNENVTAQSKNPNLSVASNIANAFINLSNLSSSSKNTNGSGGIIQAKNLNVIVTQQQITQHFMKTLSFTTSRSGIFVPNVIATNITPQFTVHQYGLHGNPNGPAPNVTVNPNGNFNSNSNGIRGATPNHFRLLFQQTPNINLNVISNQNIGNTPAVQSPILEASLQAALSKTAAEDPTTKAAQKPISTKTTIQNPILSQSSSNPTFLQQPKLIDEPLSELCQTPNSSNVNNDQHIRVLTPSEIMKTLPSLSAQENICFNNTNMLVTEKNQTEDKALNSFTKTSDTSGSVVNNSFKNSTNSSPLTITSECNTLSSNFVTTKATITSNNAQIQMVSGYKTYKNIFEKIFFFTVFLSFVFNLF